MRAVVAAILITPAGLVGATEYRIEPGSGNAQALIDSGHLVGGDRLILGPGSHGSIIISGQHFDEPVIIAGETGAWPEIDRLVIGYSAGWRIEGIFVIPEDDEGSNDGLVEIAGSSDIHLHGVKVASARDTDNWSADQWRRHARNGIVVAGKDISITDSVVRNVRHGIHSVADTIRIEGNTIELFSGDGIRGLGDDAAYVGNRIETCVKVDKNHDDGFQSWSRDAVGRPGKGVVRNVLVEGNLILNGSHPLACSLQGIGLFDGIYENWVIRDNTIIVDHWHGITVMGARNVVISGNTVLDPIPGQPGAPWITITAHKDGRVSERSVIEDNLLQPFLGVVDRAFRQPQPGVRSSGNRLVDPPPDDLLHRR